jgi:hypothetical protein
LGHYRNHVRLGYRLALPDGKWAVFICCCLIFRRDERVPGNLGHRFQHPLIMDAASAKLILHHGQPFFFEILHDQTLSPKRTQRGRAPTKRMDSAWGDLQTIKIPPAPLCKGGLGGFQMIFSKLDFLNKISRSLTAVVQRIKESRSPKDERCGLPSHGFRASNYRFRVTGFKQDYFLFLLRVLCGLCGEWL